MVACKCLIGPAYKDDTMKTRNIAGLEVSELGFGCMNQSCHFNAPVAKDQGIKTIRAAVAPHVRRPDHRARRARVAAVACQERAAQLLG